MNMYLHPASIQILEEPFQNIDEFSKQTIQQLLKNLAKEHKIIILLSNNLEDLMVASTTIHRLDGADLHALDVKEDGVELKCTL
ncbi:ABC transporter ATP-binding protein [Lysinibacillus boronitolerans]|uniref:ATP-binding cassette domain-containing protein n=1 Tax=Lysinibacillus boronitolerans TaxID=309788 RepID=UPI001EE686B1|nr:hypothetical protein [Lysinibacillus boronitolerans]